MITIEPLKDFKTRELQVPGSKYIANRAVLCAALAEGSSVLTNVPENDDIRTAAEGVRQLGAGIQWKNSSLIIQGFGAKIAAAGDVYTEASGTFSRFAAALCSLSLQPVKLSGNAKMNTRPMAELFCALRSLGVVVSSSEGDRLPAVIQGPLKGGKAVIDGSVSSQYFSALLIAGCAAQTPVVLQVSGSLVSKPYIDMTLDVLKKFGADISRDGYQSFTINPVKLSAADIHIESDPVSAGYFFAAAALLGKSLYIPGYNFYSPQGEAAFPRLLERMGCMVEISDAGVKVTGPEKLQAVTADMSDMPDVTQTAAVLAAFAEGTSTFTNIAHLAHKESDRIGETAAELRKLGVQAEAGKDFLTVHGGSPHGALCQAHADHRMAMSLALAGLKIPGVRIDDERAVDKSFPAYWQKLTELGAELNIE